MSMLGTGHKSGGGNMMTSFTVFDNKTAKSIILEVCAKRKLQVLWNSQVLQTIPPVFKSTCTIPGLGLAENGTNLTGLFE